METLDFFKKHNGASKPAHLYFHLPLCSYICRYCNFTKWMLPTDPAQRGFELDKWTDLLMKESETMMKLAPWLGQAQIQSFFVGGGTASVLTNKHLSKLVQYILNTYKFDEDAEKTLEGNPDDLMSPDKIEHALKLGFNRFSVGVQSLQDEVLQQIGRGHDLKMTLLAISELKKTGKPFNVDLIYGLPYQTPESFAGDIQTLLNLGVPTITMYRLRNNNRKELNLGGQSSYNKLTLSEQQKFPTIEETHRMRELATAFLIQANYMPSPACFWSAPATYPIANMPKAYVNKWLNYDTHIAFGPGVYGWLSNLQDQSIVQYHNLHLRLPYDKAVGAGDTAVALGYHINGLLAVVCALAFSFKSCQPILYRDYVNRFNVDISRQEPIASVLKLLVSQELMVELPNGEGLMTSLKGELLHEEIPSVFFYDYLAKEVNK